MDCNRTDKSVDDKKFPMMARLVLADTLRKSLNQQVTLWEGILGHLQFVNNPEWTTDQSAYTEWVEYILHTKEMDIAREDLIKIVPFEMYDRMIRTLHLNCITIPYNDGSREEDVDVGTGLFGLGSMFNHSCEPNVEMVNVMEMQSGYGTFKTCQAVEEGEELCIQYAGKNDRYEDRHKYLYFYYGFQCECSKCMADKKLLDAQEL